MHESQLNAELIVSGMLGLLALIGGLLAYVIKLSTKFGALELKVNTTWDFIMRRALAEGVQQGILKVNSPVTAVNKEEARAWFAHIEPELRGLVNRKGRGLSQRDLFILIEAEMGAKIWQEVCVPHNLKEGECIWLAMDVVGATIDTTRQADTLTPINLPKVP